MDPLRIYDYLTRARTHIFNYVRPLSDEQYCRVFPIGLGSLARILTHVMICEGMYVARLAGRPVLPYSEWPIQDEQPPSFAELEQHWTEQAANTRAVLAAIHDWTHPLQYQTLPDLGPVRTITTTPADLATQIAFHEIHHRAQALNILRHLGVPTADLDFNALMQNT